MSVIGSIIVFVITLNLLKGYQEDFLTPGISPLFANSLKHILHSPNALIKPCRLPHLKQRRIFLDGYLGFFFAFISCDFFAIILLPSLGIPLIYTSLILLLCFS